ncbi:hypothetical protein RJ640_000171, partial [Escallonia rubra]
MLSRPILRDKKMGKWVVALIEYNLTYIPQKAVKGQALADFLGNHPSDDSEKGVIYVGIAPWKMMFDGLKTNQGADYEALIIGLEILLDMHVTTVKISRDSQLVIKQLNGEFKCNAPGLEMYFSNASYLLTKFDDVTITHVPRIDNGSANVMAQLASGLIVPDGINEQ